MITLQSHRCQNSTPSSSHNANMRAYYLQSFCRHVVLLGFMVLALSLCGVAFEPPRLAFQASCSESVLNSTQEIVLDLGDQVCNEEVAFKWRIENPLDQEIRFPRVTSSCGCISGVPSDLKLAGSVTDSTDENSTDLKLKIRLPNHPESLTKQIVFWDGLGNARLSGVIKARVRSPVLFEREAITLESDDSTTIDIEVHSATDTIDIRTYRIVTSAIEIVDTELHSEDGKSGKLRLHVDPKKADKDSVMSEASIELLNDRDVKCYVPFTIYYAHRTLIAPKRVFYQRTSEGFQCRFNVFSPKLIQELEASNEMGVRAAKDFKTADCKVEVKNRNTKACQVVVTFDVTDKRSPPPQFELVCGAWQKELTVELP